MNKAEIIIEVSKDQNEELFKVKPLETRGLPFEPIAFEIVNDLPILTDLPEPRPPVRNPDLRSISEQDQRNLLIKVFSDDEFFKHGDLVKQIKSVFEDVYEVRIWDNKVKEFIVFCKDRSWLIQEKNRAPYTMAPSIKGPEDDW